QCGAVWCPHPRPLPHADGGNTKKPNHLAVFDLNSTYFKTHKNQHHSHKKKYQPTTPGVTYRFACFGF
ncbi:hypothetical protein ACVGXF_09085, partial [Enterobacter hormaechei]